MIKSFKYPKAALTVSALLALTSIQGPAFGEGAKIQMDGEITGSTCVLMGLANGSGSTQSATGLAMSLGKGDLSQTPTSPAVGQVLNGGTWAQQTIVFSLSGNGQAGSNSPCTSFGTNGATGWDLQATPDSSDLILTADNGTTYLKNSITTQNGGTDAVVVLKGGVGNTVVDTPLELTAAGTYLGSTGGAAFRAGAASSITMGAQLVAGTAGAKPVIGKFQSFINLLVKYN
jgi:hypothetical protein